VVRFDNAPPPPEVTTLTVDRTGTAFKDGSARITGTYVCTNADAFAFIEGTLVQVVGRVKISGSFYIDPLNCDGSLQRWEAIVTSENGLFRGGKSANVTFALACGLFDCADRYTEQTVQLSSSRRG
jgi:hypothetical protein